MEYKIVYGNIVEQDVDAIVNSWNRNIFPWWILLPQGVSRSIKKTAGYRPFNELTRMPVLKLGEAVITSAGKLPYKAIIHVAGINFFWRASPFSVEASVRNAIAAAEQLQLSTIAMPLIGSGSGGFNRFSSEMIICQVLEEITSDVKVLLVKLR